MHYVLADHNPEPLTQHFILYSASRIMSCTETPYEGAHWNSKCSPKIVTCELKM
jgi:hypothetical protein